MLGVEDVFSAEFEALGLVAVLLGGLDVGVVIVLGLLVFGRTSLGALGWRFDRLGRDVLLGLGGFVVCTGVLLVGFLIAGASPAEMFERAWGFSVAQRLIFLLIAVFGAALVEETLYRGYLQPALIRRIGYAPALIVSALVFDLMHANFAPASLVTKFVFGVVFGALRGRDRSLVAPGIAHGLIWAVYGA
ncbi:MAG: type II CAAX endopeptidase family protein [Polyangiaceae bacterium]